MRRIWAAILVLASVLGLTAGAARAAAPACAVPTGLATPRVESPSEREPRRALPIGGYTLAMFWMPERCRRGDANDCALYAASGRGGRDDGLTLHGLWPDGKDRDWPQWCAAAAPLPAATIAAHVCATPSPQLLQHEWSKHGTCMAGMTPDRYFDLSNRLFAGIKAPKLRALSYRRQTAASVAAAFAAANPGMDADMVRLNVNKKGWLEEIWLCLDMAYRPRRCAATQGGATGDARVLIWRGGVARSGGARDGTYRDDARRYGRRGGYYRRDT